jgi:outer membrane cobalamin receptor
MQLHMRFFLILISTISMNAVASEQVWQGKPVVDFVRHVATQGFKIIYSDDLVPADLLIKSEPTRDEPIAALRETVQAHGLTIADGPAGSLLIVLDPMAPQFASSGGSDPGSVPVQELLPEIVVSSSVYSIRYDKAGSHVFLDREFTAGLPDVGEEALRPLDRIPGVASGGISTRSHVRGGLANEQLIMFDGLRLYEPYHLKDFQSVATTINPGAVDGIDFYTAGYQARYGDRMSGVVDISMREPGNDTETELGISFFNTWGVSTGRFGNDGRGDWLVSARRGNLDAISRAVKPEIGEPRFFDVLSHMGWQFTDRTYVAANYLYSDDKINIAQEDDTEQAQARYRNHVAWLKAETDWSSRLDSTTILSFTDIQNSRTGLTDLPAVMRGNVDDDRAFRSFTLTQDWEFSASERWSFRTGFDVKDLDANYNYSSTLAIFPPFDQILDNEPLLQRDIELKRTGAQYAAYLEVRWRATDKLILDLGLRWDRQTYSSSEDNEQRSPRLNALYRFNENTEFRIGVGRFYQAQEINELQVSGGVNNFLRPQYADHFVVSVEHRFGSGLSLRTEYYQKDYDALIPSYENVFDPLVLIPELQIDRVAVTADKAFVKGAEISLTGGNGSGGPVWWAAYIWSSTEDKINGTDVRRSWDQKHSVKAGVSTSWGSWDISLAGSWRSGWPETQLIVETIQTPGGSPGLVATTTPRNALDRRDFHALDARASRTFRLPKSELTAFVEISNLYNRRNPCCTRYTVQFADDGSRAIKANSSNWLPLVPSLGVVWKF